MAAEAAAVAIPAALRRVAFIGAGGVMGRSMAGHLLRAGCEVRVCGRTPAKLAPLVEAGARLAATPREAAEGADVAISIVGYPADVREVLLGEHGVLSAAAKPRYLIDMTTSSPELAKEVAAAAAAAGVAAVDAPVSGGDIGARNATLSIMCGGEAAAFEAVQPLLGAMGKNIRLLGGPGAGQHTKMCNQILIATNMIGLCESLLYARAAGLDPEAVIAAVSTGAAGSWSLSNLGPRILAGNFEPGFFVEHFVKDIGIALEEAARMGLTLPGLALAQQLYTRTCAQYGKKGTQALYLALDELQAEAKAGRA